VCIGMFRTRGVGVGVSMFIVNQGTKVGEEGRGDGHYL